MTSFQDILGKEEIPAGTQPLIKDAPLLGFRKWNIDENNDLLLAMNGTAWQPGLNLAHGCSHPSPGEGCHCGFSAWYGFESNETSRYSGITGAIAGAGNIQLHSEGFLSVKGYSTRIKH